MPRCVSLGFFVFFALLLAFMACWYYDDLKPKPIKATSVVVTSSLYSVEVRDRQGNLLCPDKEGIYHLGCGDKLMLLIKRKQKERVQFDLITSSESGILAVDKISDIFSRTCTPILISRSCHVSDAVNYVIIGKNRNFQWVIKVRYEKHPQGLVTASHINPPELRPRGILRYSRN